MDGVLELAEQVADARCSKCGELKPRTEFYADRRKASGRKSWCKACHYADGHARRLASGASYKGKHAPAPDGFQPCQRCGEVKHATEYHAARRNSAKPPYLAGRQRVCRQCVGERQRREKYGEDAAQAFAAHDGPCEACGREGELVIDHNHETGEYRALPAV